VEISASRRKGSVDQFLGAFDSFARAVRRARGARANDPDGGLTLSQYGLLEPLADRAGARVSELAEEAGIAPSTASRILDALERRGIVARRRDAGDRRGVAIALTPKGERVLCSEHEWLRARQRDFYASLPAEEQVLAPDLLLRLAALIDELAAGRQ
jgi:DNA-binding MarR family transcriptional regulator